MTKDEYGELILSRTHDCSGCGLQGVHVDTTAGEITDQGEVVATAPAGCRILLVGREDGSRVDGLFCEECAKIGPEPERRCLACRSLPEPCQECKTAISRLAALRDYASYTARHPDVEHMQREADRAMEED